MSYVYRDHTGRKREFLTMCIHRWGLFYDKRRIHSHHRLFHHRVHSFCIQHTSTGMKESYRRSWTAAYNLDGLVTIGILFCKRARWHIPLRPHSWQVAIVSGSPSLFFVSVPLQWLHLRRFFLGPLSECGGGGCSAMIADKNGIVFWGAKGSPSGSLVWDQSFWGCGCSTGCWSCGGPGCSTYTRDQHRPTDLGRE